MISFLVCNCVCRLWQICPTTTVKYTEWIVANTSDDNGDNPETAQWDLMTNSFAGINYLLVFTPSHALFLLVSILSVLYVHVYTHRARAE